MNGVPLNLDIQQILLHLLNFVILFAILYFLLYKPVRNFMDKRKAAYQQMDDEANAKRADAEALKADYEKQLAGVTAEIAEMKTAATLEAEKKAKGIEAQAKEEAAGIISDAKRQAESEKSRILAEAGDEITQMAQTAAEKALFGTTSEAMDSFLDMVEEDVK